MIWGAFTPHEESTHYAYYDFQTWNISQITFGFILEKCSLEKLDAASFWWLTRATTSALSFVVSKEMNRLLFNLKRQHQLYVILRIYEKGNPLFQYPELMKRISTRIPREKFSKRRESTRWRGGGEDLIRRDWSREKSPSIWENKFLDITIRERKNL